MGRLLAITLQLTLLITAACTSVELSEKRNSAAEFGSGQDQLPYVPETVAEHLNVPWDMDIAPDGRLFFTERPGTIRVIEGGKLSPVPVLSMEAPFLSKGEGGLLGIVLDPNFAVNHFMYVYHTYTSGNETANRVLRLLEKDNRATIDRVLLDGIPGAANHNGGRLKIGPDGYLYVTTGERYEPSLAQDRSSLGGKILRIALDGSIPPDNPIQNSPVYSLGHRNPQGLAWHPVTKQLYASEHGQSAHDEINLIEPGANYGWPVIQGDETSSANPAMKRPIIHSGRETWAPSGIAFISQGPWQGRLLVACLRGERLMMLTFESPDNTKVAKLDTLFDQWGRIRNVYEAPDGSVYVMTNNRDGRGDPRLGDDKLIRLKPRG